jgi:hypothetical protein
LEESMRKEKVKLDELVARDTEHKKALRTNFYKLADGLRKAREEHPDSQSLKELEVPLNATRDAVDGLAYGHYYGPLFSEVEEEEEEPPRR